MHREKIYGGTRVVFHKRAVSVCQTFVNGHLSSSGFHCETSPTVYCTLSQASDAHLHQATQEVRRQNNGERRTSLLLNRMPPLEKPHKDQTDHV